MSLGSRGRPGTSMGEIDSRGNIFEGPRRREYPMPPLRGTGFTEMMTDAARKLGWHPFPGPAAINSRTYKNRAACAYHGYCSPRRLSHQGEGINRSDHYSQGPEDWTPRSRHAGRPSRRSKSTPTDASAVSITSRTAWSISSRRMWYCWRAMSTRMSGSYCCPSPGRIRTGCRITTGKWVGTTSATTQVRLSPPSFPAI